MNTINEVYEKSWINRNRRIYYDKIEKRKIRFSHFVWNFYHPEDKITKGDGYSIHHEDEDTLNDSLYNLEKKLRGRHSADHNSGNKYCFGYKHTENAKKIMSELKKGKNNPNYGKKASKETKEKKSKAMKEYYRKLKTWKGEVEGLRVGGRNERA